MKNLNNEQITKIIKDKYPDARNIWLFDRQYTAPSKKEFQKMLVDVKPIEMAFEDELFDCEDFAIVTSAFIKIITPRYFKNPLAFGEVTVRNTGINEIHTLNILITDTEKILYFEPQKKKFIDGHNYEPFFVRI